MKDEGCANILTTLKERYSGGITQLPLEQPIIGLAQFSFAQFVVFMLAQLPSYPRRLSAEYGFAMWHAPPAIPLHLSAGRSGDSILAKVSSTCSCFLGAITSTSTQTTTVTVTAPSLQPVTTTTTF